MDILQEAIDLLGYDVLQEGNFSLASTQFDLNKNTNPIIEKEVLDFGKKISDSDVYDKEEGYGRENNIHCTVLYGITDDNCNDTKELIKGTKPFEIELGKVSFFENEKFDVMKIEVINKDLTNLSNKIKDNIKNKNSYDKYEGHITIAYLNKGFDQSSVDENYFKNKKLTHKVDNILFSDKDGNKTRMNF